MLTRILFAYVLVALVDQRRLVVARKVGLLFVPLTYSANSDTSSAVAFILTRDHLEVDGDKRAC